MNVLIDEVEHLFLNALKLVLSKELPLAELQLAYAIYKDIKGYVDGKTQIASK